MAIGRNILSRHSVPNFKQFYPTTTQINEQEDNSGAGKKFGENLVQIYNDTYLFGHHKKCMFYGRNVFTLTVQD